MNKRVVFCTQVHHFYEQIEELINPSLKNKAYVIVSGQEIFAMSQEAKARCGHLYYSLQAMINHMPSLRIVEAHQDIYKLTWIAIENIMKKYSNHVYRYDDELWVDMSYTAWLYRQSTMDVICDIYRQVQDEVKINISINVADSYLHAHAYQNLNDGVFCIQKEDIQDQYIPVMPYITKHHLSLLKRHGYETIADLHRCDELEFYKILDKDGLELWDLLYDESQRENDYMKEMTPVDQHIAVFTTIDCHHTETVVERISQHICQYSLNVQQVSLYFVGQRQEKMVLELEEYNAKSIRDDIISSFITHGFDSDCQFIMVTIDKWQDNEKQHSYKHSFQQFFKSFSFTPKLQMNTK